MARRKHRLELYLPLQFNPDADQRRADVPPELLRETREELKNHFQELGISFDFITKDRTYGEYKGIVDELMLVMIDVKLSWTHRKWLRQYKETLKERFAQEEIYIIYFSISVV